MEKLTIEGKTFEGWTVPTPKVKILIIRAPKGMLCCGYISAETADKFGDCVAIVRGVNSYGDMLSAKVALASKEAKAIGVEVGQSGQSALMKML